MLTSSFLERRLRYGLMVYGLHLTSLAIIEASCRVAGLETTLASVLQPLAPIRGSLPQLVVVMAVRVARSWAK